MRTRKSIFPNHLVTVLNDTLTVANFPDIRVRATGVISSNSTEAILGLASVVGGFNAFLKVEFGNQANNFRAKLSVSYTNTLGSYIEIGTIYSRKVAYVTIYSELLGSFSNLHIIFTSGDLTSKLALVIQQVNDMSEPVINDRPKYKILNIDVPVLPFTVTGGANGESFADGNGDVTHFLTYLAPYMVVQPEFLTGIAKVLPNGTVYSDTQFDQTIGIGSSLREEVLLQGKPFLIAI